jgi:uncharacterized protein (TIGR03437 family)
MYRQLTAFPKVIFAILAGCFLLGLSDTAKAQGVTLQVSPTTLTFNNAISGQSQNVAVSSNQPTSVVILLGSNSSFLSITPNNANISSTPTNLSVKVNTLGLNPGSYVGSFIVAIPGSNIQQTVTVNVTVGTTTAGLIATPANVSFTAQQGAVTGTPSTTNVRITSANPGISLSYTLTAATLSGGPNWLLLDHLSGTTGDAGFNVSTNPQSLAAGVYTGTITATSTTTSDVVQISVTLTVNSTATLSVSPANPPPFLYQIGGSIPNAVVLSVNSSSGPLTYSVQNPGVSWLVINPLTGTASPSNPGSITLSVTPQNLQAGTYQTNVVITPGNSSSMITIPVTLIVSTNPILTISTNTLTFTAQFSGSAPPDQTVNVTTVGVGAGIGYTISSDSSWLTASTTSPTTPSVLTVHVNPSGLLVGSYIGKITLRPATGENYSQVITVNLTVANASQLTAGPPLLLFSWQTNQQPPQPQNFQILSNGNPTPITVTTSTTSCGPNWLGANPSSNTAPTVVTVNVLTTGLTPGSCNGSVSIAYGSNQTLTVPITLSVTGNPQLAISMPAGFGAFTIVQGGNPISQSISLSSTDPATPVGYTATSPTPWISLQNTQGNTPQQLVVNVFPGTLTQGIYSGSIVISSASLLGNSIIIPVTLTITPNTVVTITPSGPLTFTQSQGGTVPPAQTLALSANGGTATFSTNVITNNGGDWLGASPNSGQVTGNLTVSIKPNSLSQGTYTGSITLLLQGASVLSMTINVTLNVGAQQFITVAPSGTFTFNYQLGSTLQPPPQRFSVTSSGGPTAFTVASASTPSGWLSTDIPSGNTPKDVNIQVNASGLALGTYNGTVTVTAPGTATGTISIPVVLTVTNPPAPTPMTIASNANGVSGRLAPGEIISIYGTNLGPTTPVSFKVNSAGAVDNKLGNVQVLFNNVPGTPLYVSDKQINVTVPYEVRGQLSTNVVVQYQGVSSAGFTLGIADSAPGIYTLNSQGFGQAAAINQNGTFNGTGANGTIPATQGSIVSIYATGGGQTNPTSVTGSVSSTTQLLNLIGKATATVGGAPATVTFAGAAPGLVTGVVQVNIQLPNGVTGDNVPISFAIDGNMSLAPAGTNGATLAIR